MDCSTSGKIVLDNKEISNLNKKELTKYRRTEVGFVFQFYNLMPNLTAIENVELATEICKDALNPKEILIEVGFGERLAHFPAQLSGGEQQRVSIARKKPVTLLSPKTAKHGKRLFLEKIPSIWNKCSFKFKSTLRNVFLFKSRFFMTVISIIGSAVLVFVGMGIMDCSKNIHGGESLITISLALLVFSAILCALVIYNISNINICERTREISTLMVLGYNDNEVCGYIFREIYIMSIIGAILGSPVSLVFIKFVFRIIDFGTIADINWWTWILTPLITMLFTFLSKLILRRKIVKTDMNASLKSNE